MARHGDIELEAARTVPELLSQWLRRPVTADSYVSHARDYGIDMIVTAGQDLRLAVQCKSSNRAATVSQAARAVHDAASHLGAEPLLVVPYMGQAGAVAAAEADVSWIDLAGNADVRIADRYIVHVEGRPNRHPERGRPATPFAPASSRVSRLMLSEPTRWWQQRDLVEESRLAASQVSKVIRRLADDELLAISDNEHRTRYRPADPDRLLDSWAAEYDFRRHRRVTAHISGSGIEVARKLSTQLARTGVSHAFTGLPAAWLIDGFAQFRLTSVYVADDPDHLADTLSLRRESRGANIELVSAYDEGVLDRTIMLDGITCAAPVQVYLDLLGLPERASEAAQHLRESDLIFPAE